ncbi:hypothetical protein [Pseudoroseomonas ludipueritiae]|uniref:Uncharacterized protein n=1 Tax=Pseudoroseomonas ludipueritiae TaxID=198093 RepID=A0ABR7R5Q2_9PROT|nr:hypothetical protein [Pseudoroseomonas ludipueritiae]MBC9177053.1 hypothetical protein [Pseudoroseomonas ludipueritiae]
MALDDKLTLRSMFPGFTDQALQDLDPALRERVARELEERARRLAGAASGDPAGAFSDLLGLAAGGPSGFGAISWPEIAADFDDSIIPAQIQAAAELYFVYQHERMGVFRVVDLLRRLFHEGRMKVHRGPGARGLYLLDKWQPLRYEPRDRLAAYMRVFNYGRAPRPPGAIVNVNFHFQLVALMTALAQYFRDLTISEVIKGSPALDQRPFGTLAVVQRLGTDLRYALDRASYGNVMALAMEASVYLKQILEILDAPDIKKSFDARTKWDVVEAVLNQRMGGARELSQRAKMAEAGRAVLLWVSGSAFDTNQTPADFQATAQTAAAQAEAWIAAYRMTDEGRRFPGVTESLRWAVGMPARDARMVPI